MHLFTLSEALKKIGLVPWPVGRLAFKDVGRAVRTRAVKYCLNRVSNRKEVNVSCISFFQEVEVIISWEVAIIHGTVDGPITSETLSLLFMLHMFISVFCSSLSILCCSCCYSCKSLSGSLSFT